jgi:hypothetical protein
MPNFIVPGLRSVQVGQVQENGVKARLARAAEDFKKTRRVKIRRCLWKFPLILQPFEMKDVVGRKS